MLMGNCLYKAPGAELAQSLRTRFSSAEDSQRIVHFLTQINEYAAELARVTVWIGELQWMRSHGYPIRRDPSLETLERIENRDALISADGSEADWPDCDAIVGNPPFIGDKMMRGELGADYVTRLRQRCEGRFPGGADLVTYWSASRSTRSTPT